MSIINTSAPYRRSAHATMRVPVVMPLVEVNVDQDGYLVVSLEHEPYTAERALRREDLKRVLNEIAADLDTPIRVEVHETDATTFTDIVAPTELSAEHTITPATPPRAPQERRQAITTGVGTVAGDGFLPNENVAFAVVVAQHAADSDGSTVLRLPPALLEGHPGMVVLFGRQSGTVIVCGGEA